jgi:hypothetical protein
MKNLAKRSTPHHTSADGVKVTFAAISNGRHLKLGQVLKDHFTSTPFPLSENKFLTNKIIKQNGNTN